MSVPAQDTTYTTLTTALLLYLALILVLPRVAKWYETQKDSSCVVLAHPVYCILYSALGSFRLCPISRPSQAASMQAPSVNVHDAGFPQCCRVGYDYGDLCWANLLYDVPCWAKTNDGDMSYGDLGSYSPALVIGSAKGDLRQLPS